MNAKSTAPVLLLSLLSGLALGQGKPAHVGASPFEPPQITDTSFVVDTGSPGLDTGCTFRSGGPLVINISIDRVVGDVNADNTLAAPLVLVANGVVSKFAYLRMPAFDVDFDAAPPLPLQPERDHVRLNGKEIGPGNTVAFLTGANNIWKLNEFKIPIELLRFGARHRGAAPVPATNVIQIVIDEANIPSGKEQWCTAIDWAQISFEALAPVIMVHGNNSAGTFFSDFNYIQPFQAQKIPFDNSINLVTNPIAVNSARLAVLIPERASEFGAKHAHIVAHSKGGLDTRDFLARTIPPNFGVLSLTTLSTPHHGSAGADYSIDAVTAAPLYSDDTTRTKLAKQVPPDLGTPALRVSSVAAFNAANLPLLPKKLTVDGVTDRVVYRSFSADANLDNSTSFFGNPTISHDETMGTKQPSFVPDTAWDIVMEQVYRLLGNVTSTTLGTRTITVLTTEFPSTKDITVFVVKETPTTSFQFNDFLVTIPSARVKGFTELASTKDNHATIANPLNGVTTIKAIKAIQPVK